MIQSSFRPNQSVCFKVLSDDAIHEIKRAAFDVLEKTGCKIMHGGARKMLKSAGAIVRDDIVKIPEYIVKTALATAPNGVTIYDRQGRRAMELQGTNSHYGTSTASPNTRDATTGEIHETRVVDIARGALVADALSNIDWVMPMGSSQDVPAIAADVHEFEAVVTNTVKPMVFIGYSPRGNELVYEMAAAVAGGADRLREKPFLISYPEPITPLVFPGEVGERMSISADLYRPHLVGPTQQLGATSPVTVAGAVVLAIAEGLASITLAQLRQPGTPCFMACNVSTFDMSTSMLSIQSPEGNLGFAAQAEVARSFGLPTWGLAGATDSKTIDAQAGIDSAFSILAQGLAGLNMIHDVGYMDSGMVCSAEMLVLGDEVVGMTKRFVQGIEISRDTLAREVIENVGPGGHFLGQDHTFHRFKKELWRPTLLTRESYDVWVDKGSKDMAQRVKERVKTILDTHEVAPLPHSTLATLKEMKRKGEAELVSMAG